MENKDIVIDFLLAKPTRRYNRYAYFINTDFNTKHVTSKENFVEIVKDINKYLVHKVWEMLNQNIAFYINFDDKEVKELSIDMKEEIEAMKKELNTYSQKRIKAIHNEIKKKESNSSNDYKKAFSLTDKFYKNL